MVFPVLEDGKYGFIDTTGRMIIKPQFDHVEVLEKPGSIHDKPKHYLVKKDISEEGKTRQIEGLVSYSGVMVIAPKYQAIQPFHHGLAPVFSFKKKKWGCINEKGKEVIKTKYDQIKRIDEEYVMVKVDKKYGMIDKKDKWLVPAKFNDSDFYYFNKKYIWRRKSGKPILIDIHTGIQKEFTFVIEDYFSNEYAAISVNNKFGFINKKFEMVIEPRFEKDPNHWMRFNKEGFAIVKENGRFGVINTKGDYIIESKYDDIKNGGYDFMIVKLQEKMGLVDRNGNIIADPIFDGIQVDREDMISASVGSKKGFINKNGDFIILQKENEVIDCFNNGYARFNIGGWQGKLKDGYSSCIIDPDGGKWGLYDKNGTIVIDPKFDWIGRVCEGTVRVNTGKKEDNALLSLNNSYTIDKNNRLTTVVDIVKRRLNESLTEITKNGKFGLIDNNGNTILECIYNDPFNFINGYSIITFGGEWNYMFGCYFFEKKGLINDKGEIVIKPVYDDISNYSNGLIMVNIGQVVDGQGITYGKAGFVDQAGKLVIPMIYDKAYEFSDGSAIVMKKINNQIKYGLIDTEGKIVIPIQYEEIFYQSEYIYKAGGNEIDIRKEIRYQQIFPTDEGISRIMIVEKGVEKWGLINTSDSVYIVNPVYDFISNFCNGIAVFESNNKKGLLRQDGVVIWPAEYDEIRICDDEGNGLDNDRILVRTKTSYGYYSLLGKEIVKPLYSDAAHFSDGLAGVKIGDKYGFIDINGKVVIPPQFDEVGLFNEGYAGVKIDGKWGFIDKTGTIKVKPQYREVGKFINGQATVYPMSYYGFVDTNGNVVIPPIYQKAEDFFHGLAKVVIDGKDAYINTKGEVVWKQK